MSHPDHSTRTIVALGTLATLAALLMGATGARADEARTDENGRPCATSPAPTRGVYPLTFCSPALDRAKAGEAEPEARGGSTRSIRSIVTTREKNGSTRIVIKYGR